jgi:hypothetical protein
VAPNPEKQGDIFLDRIRQLFLPEASGEEEDDERRPRRGLALAICFLISSVIWLALTLQEERTVSFEVPTRVVNMPADQALKQVPPSTVSVQVSGEGRQLIWLYMNPPTLPIDAASSEVNVASALDLTQEAGVRIESVEPRRVDLVKEERVERRIPIASRVELQLPPAHELLSDPSFTPDSVTVSGAASVVASLDAWPTERRVLENVTDTLDATVALLDTLSRLTERSVRSIRIHAEAGKFAEATREIDVQVTGLPADQNVVALDPSTIRVRYRVLFDQLFESQRASNFFATVAYQQVRADTTGYVEPRIHTPPEIVIRDPEPMPSRLQYYTFVSSE